MMLGTLQPQIGGYKAFVPNKFPPKNLSFSDQLLKKNNEATRLIGKLDGISQLLPDVDLFLLMYVRKDAASSSQIEGTRATMLDAIELDAKISGDLPDDVNDIIHHIAALNYGLNRLKNFPLSLRVIKEIHDKLMNTGRKTHFADPGNFRNSQNWIGGTSPKNASFAPPPAHELNRAMGDLENFFYSKDTISPLIKAGLIHAQFETIHPFLDGNGRTGRMLITLFLWQEQLLEKPLLFLSSFFRKHRQLYYDRLHDYHLGKIENWLDFFLTGICEIAEESATTVKEITKLREQDLKKIQALGKTESKSAAKILPELFKTPIINVARIQEITGYTRAGAGKVLDRFIKMGILEQKDESKTYGRSFIYRPYVNIFSK
ncbi:MAG: Fic family protein [Alphaproteobacteria bacterium]|nr:Fic family protein [Alphaproteobacteria bacterium]